MGLSLLGYHDWDQYLGSTKSALWSLCVAALSVPDAGCGSLFSGASPGISGGYAFQPEGIENPSFSRPPFLSRLLEYMGTVFGAPLAKGLLVMWGKGHNLCMGSGVSRAGQGWMGPSASHPHQLFHWKSPEQILSISPQHRTPSSEPPPAPR